MTEQEYIHEAPRIRKLMFDNAMRFLDSVEDAKDVVQNCLMKLWLMRDKVRLATLDALSVKIVRHQCLDFLKKKNRCKLCDLEAVEETQEADDIETPEMLEEQDQRLMRSLEKMPSRRRMLLELMYLKGKDVETIAQVTGMSVDNVRRNLSRARATLFRIMSSVVVLIVVFSISFDFVFNNRLEKTATPLNAPVAEAEKPVARRQEAETAADTSQSEGAKSSASVVASPSAIAKTESASRQENVVAYSDTVSREVYVCYMFETEKVLLMAKMSVEKTADGKIRSSLSEYSVVSNAGSNAAFVPSAEMYSGLDSADLKVRLSGTLVYENSEGKTHDRDVLIEKEVF
ncbi:MAG: sigma-70 family RNA polymerase sigma factor [Prevotellaceae bacterium]|nr:sigma-70 family RNA polymerase sigma factor [Prevotellaceae bacterium]